MDECERRPQIQRSWEAPGVDPDVSRGDNVARETIYVTEPWEAPEWRRPWRAAP
jgi:hypothetical protein